MTPHVPPPALAGKAGKVLIIDDEQSMGETLAVYLTRRGFDATWRPSALAALVLLEVEDFDVVVTDLNMDEINGLALCERIVVIRPGLPVIVTTGFGAPDARIAALRAGAYEFLPKPIDLDLLRLTLERALLSAGGTGSKLVVPSTIGS